MTLVVGMYYDNQKGAVIASDSKVVKGSNCSLIKKVFNIENLVIAQCGTIWTWGELIQDIESILNYEADIKKVMQNAQRKLYDDYVSEKNPILDEAEMPQGLCGFYTNHSEIFRFFDRITEPIDNFSAVGQEEDEVENFLKKIYRKNITKERAIELAVYSIMETAKNNIYVDDNPQIALINNKGCKILNYDSKGNFIFKKPEVVKIKRKIEEVSRRHEKALDILFGEDENTRGKLIKLLDGYKPTF